MKTFNVIFIIVAIIGLGLFLKHKGYIFSGSKSPKKDSFRSTEAINGDSGSGVNDTLTSHNSQNWSATLKGKWEFTEVYVNGSIRQELTGDIEFTQNNEFILHVTSKIFYKDSYGNFTNIQGTDGGYTRGMWKLSSNGFILHNLKDCNITNDRFTGCKYFENRVYGDVEGNFKSEVKSLSDKVINITGKMYSTDSKYSCTFTKI